MGKLAAMSVVVAGLVATSPAQAGVYTDDLSKCLVKAASPQDQQSLTQWIFAIIAAHPAVQNYAKISADERKTLNLRAAQIIQRFMTVDCRPETVAALKYEGNSAIEASFNVLGQVAMRGLMGDPAVVSEMGNFAKNVDEDAMSALFKEAGLRQ
jgi:hypothetical protein